MFDIDLYKSLSKRRLEVDYATIRIVLSVVDLHAVTHIPFEYFGLSWRCSAVTHFRDALS